MPPGCSWAGRAWRLPAKAWNSMSLSEAAASAPAASARWLSSVAALHFSTVQCVCPQSSLRTKSSTSARLGSLYRRKAVPAVLGRKLHCSSLASNSHSQLTSPAVCDPFRHDCVLQAG